ncbi:DUF6671 family protein [Microbacterium chocolatum]|uniref:DUF6671 family protein n=1 Tax=Microbacterium aurantiacum TaxID=162393 RepID=UPI00338FF7F3
MTASPYRGEVIAFATMHGKERLARDAFRDVLGARVVAPAGLDTDAFGSFSGEVPRTRSPLDTARAKARLALDTSGATAALASEGSFRSDFGWLTRHQELLVFVDDVRRIELVEAFAGPIELPPARDVTTGERAVAFAEAMGFPRQGVMVHADRAQGTEVAKELRTPNALAAHVDRLARAGASLTITPDYRAHRSSARSEVIRRLCLRMAERLAAPCPACATPGYGRTDVRRGLPCGDCGEPTSLPLADVHGCAACDASHLVPRTPSRAEPRWCDRCNP